MNIIKSLKPPPLGFASSKPKSHEFPTTKKWNLGLPWNRCCCFVGWNSLLEFITSMGRAHFVRISFSMKFLSIHCSGFPIFHWNLVILLKIAYTCWAFSKTEPTSNPTFKGKSYKSYKLISQIGPPSLLNDSPRIGVGLSDHQLAVSFVSTLTHEEDDFP